MCGVAFGSAVRTAVAAGDGEAATRAVAVARTVGAAVAFDCTVARGVAAGTSVGGSGMSVGGAETAVGGTGVAATCATVATGTIGADVGVATAPVVAAEMMAPGPSPPGGNAVASLVTDAALPPVPCNAQLESRQAAISSAGKWRVQFGWVSRCGRWIIMSGSMPPRVERRKGGHAGP